MDGKTIIAVVVGVILAFAFFLIARYTHIGYDELALGMIAFHIGDHIANRN